MREAAQQDSVGQREADPVDPQQRHEHPPQAGPALQQREHKQQRKRDHRDEQHLVVAAVQRRGQQSGECDKAGQAHRVGALEHGEQLVHAHSPEHEQPHREHGSPLDDEEQRHRDRRHRGDQPRAQVRALAGGGPATAARAGAAPAGPTGARAGSHRPAYRLPKRRRRREYSASDCSRASREKSGHSSSRNTSSE